jgi:hypothetical protein
MDIPDIAPVSYFSEFYKIPSGVVILIIFLAGYFTIKLAQQTYALNKRYMESIDTIFIMALTGMTWFLRIAILVFWIQSLSNNPEIIQQYKGIPIMYVYGLGVFIIISSFIDVNAILNRNLLVQKPFKMSKNQKWNNIRKWYDLQRYKFIIIIATLFSLVLSSGLFTYVSQGIDFLFFAIFYFFMVFFTVTPMISMQILMMKKLLYPSISIIDM